MRWPWVGRTLYEYQKTSSDEWENECARLEARWQERYDALLTTVIHMKREGFVAQPDPSEFIPQPQSVDETDEERALGELHG